MEAGYALPAAPGAVATYVPAVLDGELLLVSGQLPLAEGRLLASGVVGEGVSVEEAAAGARQCALNGLAVAKAALGDLGRVRRVLKVGVFVACTKDFTQHPQVANGASDLLVLAFGEAGRHARAAVGSPSLPRGAAVEVEFMFRVG